MGIGDYCWIFGSDDIFIKNFFVLMEDKLVVGSDIYLCDRWELDILMMKIFNLYWWWLNGGSRLFFFSNEVDLIEYFSKCNLVGGFFSYLSFIIVKRNKWFDVLFDELYIGIVYVYVYILLRIINNMNLIL